MSNSQRSIVVCMAGTNPNRERFVQMLHDERLASHCTECIQITSPIGRDKTPGAKNLPDDFEADELAQVAIDVAERTRRTLENLHSSLERTHIFFDYEAREYADDGSIIGSWMLNKIRHGFDYHDLVFLHACRRGVQIESNGLDFSFYTVPRLSKGPLVMKDIANILSAQKIIPELGWIWHNAYPHNSDERDWIDETNIEDHRRRIGDGYTALRIMTQKPVLSFLFPHYFMSREETRVYQVPTIQMLKEAGATKLGIWVDVNHEWPTNQQIANVREIAPELRAWVGVSEEVTG